MATEQVTALRVFLDSVVDYAGLFPPAALSLPAAAARYARYRQSPESWMLGKFIVPLTRVSEFNEVQLDVSSAAEFPLSVLSTGDFSSDAQLLERAPNAQAIEIKASSASQIQNATRALPGMVEKYFEITDLSLIPVIAAHGARAKIRMGGITPDAFPTPEFVAQFLIACARENVLFKATAGLHHPLRSYRPLTYAESSPHGWMFGFLNVLAAATFARDASADDLRAILLAENIEDLRLFDGKFAQKRELAISIGSCSFEEPVADLKSLKLL